MFEEGSMWLYIAFWHFCVAQLSFRVDTCTLCFFQTSSFCARGSVVPHRLFLLFLWYWASDACHHTMWPSSPSVVLLKIFCKRKKKKTLCVKAACLSLEFLPPNYYIPSVLNPAWRPLPVVRVFKVFKSFCGQNGYVLCRQTNVQSPSRLHLLTPPRDNLQRVSKNCVSPLTTLQQPLRKSVLPHHFNVASQCWKPTR